MTQIPTTPNRLESFRTVLEAAQREGLIRRGFKPENHRHDCRVKLGRKYANVDVGDSGKYMVELTTSRIYGIKGYGVISRAHCYGTLDTLDCFDWSGYTATRTKREG